MTPPARLLASMIERSGPIPFRRFMETALYHPEHGYYRRPRDPFGASGDFYTAEQLQPVFGRLIAACFEQLARDLPGDLTVLEIGAGRGEMEPAFTGLRYRAADLGDPLPPPFAGFVFANEFFDALPVDVVVRRDAVLRERLVGWDGAAFHWIDGGPARPELVEYVERNLGGLAEGCLAEVCLDSLAWLDRLAGILWRGYILIIDYGYTRAELGRFPQGSLMSYQRHAASEHVLSDPGNRDITAHVNFTALEEHAGSLGLEVVSFEPLARLLLRAGEPDRFAGALRAETYGEELRHRLQLKTLLFSMGETFRALLLRKP